MFWAEDMTEIIDRERLKKNKKPRLRQMRVDLYASLRGLFLTMRDKNLLRGCSGITRSLS
jgi:AMMECR1 domain-containing protein